MLKKILNAVVLPPQISDFEAKYLARMNRVGFIFFALHVPVFALIAFFNNTGPLLAVALTLAVMAGPALAMRTFKNPRNVSLVYGFTAMLMGGLLVHFGQGPMQIEMHFYFFALIAMLAVFGNPLAIVVAAGTVAVHHLAVFLLFPSSVFNYEASIWVVLVHATFVVLESIATCFIARSFFDNVIGLEKIVQARTSEIDSLNKDMRLVLDHVGQGFLTIDRDAAMSPEKSKRVEDWFGAAASPSFVAYMAQHSADFAAAFEMGWEEVLADILPLELTMAQLPSRFVVGEKSFRVDYTPIMRGEALEKTLVVITETTAELARERLEAEQRDVVALLERIGKDRAGVIEFVDEARTLVASIEKERDGDRSILKRVLHTLKGNSAIFGVSSIAEMCHHMESRLEEGQHLAAADTAALKARWDRLCHSLDVLLGGRAGKKIEIDDAEYHAILRAVLRGDSRDDLAARITDWKLEPAATRLGRLADQAQRLAARLDKPLSVAVAHNDVRLDPTQWASFWSAFIHVVRNAVDHGIEPSSERSAAGKPPQGELAISTRFEGSDFVVEISDDGRGIDWSRVSEMAAERGVPNASKTDLLEALFVDGVSTKREVTDVSGRGIGMGAVRAATLERGGRLSVDTAPGAGTRIRFTFPRTAAASQLPKAA